MIGTTTSDRQGPPGGKAPFGTSAPPGAKRSGTQTLPAFDTESVLERLTGTRLPGARESWSETDLAIGYSKERGRSLCENTHVSLWFSYRLFRR